MNGKAKRKPTVAPPLTRRKFISSSAVIAGGALIGGHAVSARRGGDDPAGWRAGRSAPASTRLSATAGPALVRPSSTVTLNLWTWAWPEEPIASELKSAFESAVPEVVLEVNKFPYPDYTTALRTGMPNGTAGHVVHMQTGSMLRQYGQFLTPLDDLATGSYGEGWQDDFIGGALQEVRDSDPDRAGTLLALPQQYSVGGVMWVAYPILGSVGASVPASHDDYVKLAAALREENLVAATWGAKDNWPNTDYLVQFASQFSPGIIARAEAGEASFADDAIVRGLNYMKRTLDDNLWNRSPFATTAFPEAYNLFFEDKAASAALGTWASGTITGDLTTGEEHTRREDWGAFLWPQLPDAEPDEWLPGIPSGIREPSSMAPVRPWRTVNVATAMRNDISEDEQWAAWKFIEWSCGPEGQQLGATTYTPARSGIRPEGLGPEWEEIFDWHNALAEHAERREFDYAETRTALESAIAEVCVNGADAAEQLKRVDDAAAGVREA